MQEQAPKICVRMPQNRLNAHNYQQGDKHNEDEHQDQVAPLRNPTKALAQKPAGRVRRPHRQRARQRRDRLSGQGGVGQGADGREHDISVELSQRYVNANDDIKAGPHRCSEIL